MIYRSNLVAPDLTPHFKHIWSRVQPHSHGHDVLSDWGDGNAADDPQGFYRENGFWTHDEAAILYNCAVRTHGLWLDIGAYTGWTTAHLAAAMEWVTSLDPVLKYQAFQSRFEENLRGMWDQLNCVSSRTSDAYFDYERERRAEHSRRAKGLDIGPLEFTGVVIDGEHGWHQPLKDAQNAAAHLAPDGVILFHDFIGGPVQEGVRWLQDNGFRCRIYNTPFMVACCWRGKFTPPDHVPDPNIPDMRTRCPDFDFSRCESRADTYMREQMQALHKQLLEDFS